MNANVYEIFKANITNAQTHAHSTERERENGWREQERKSIPRIRSNRRREIVENACTPIMNFKHYTPGLHMFRAI